MTGSPFENLLNQYIGGQLDYITYRQKRSILINQIVCENLDSDKTVPSSSDSVDNALTQRYKIDDKDAIRSEDFVVPILDEEDEPTNYFVLKSIILTSLVIVATLSWYYSEHIINTPKKSEIQQITKLKTQTIPEEISILLKSDLWSKEMLDGFVKYWNSLTENNKGNLKQTTAFTELSLKLRQRIDEQKALNEDKTHDKNQEKNLVWFASQLNITL